jgi:subtilisin family serine protease
VRRLRRGLVITAALAAVLVLAPPAGAGKLRTDLAALVYGPLEPDRQVSRLIPDRRPGEIAYFVEVRGAATPARERALGRLGARVLRSYGPLDVYAVASRRAVVPRIAALRWVTRLQPVELVHAQADEPLADQTRGSPADVGATALWNQGFTGGGVRVAVLDTGVDAVHPDLDDLDFRHWSNLVSPAKIVAQRNFNNGQCLPGAVDGHGHGTHVAGIATGTGEGGPLATPRGKYAGIAPDATLGVGKVLDDTGAGTNSDLLLAMLWAAAPGNVTVCPGVNGLDADVVNMSLDSDARPLRLNSTDDADLVSRKLNELAKRYGTLFVTASGNSGPYLGSALESPGSAAQALTVGASAKDYDLNHDDTYSGDSCAGYLHPATPPKDNTCPAGDGTQPPSLASFSSRGPTGDLWLKPDVVAPGYNIVAPQASAGTAMAQNDLNLATRTDPLYATASGTSMAAPTVAGASALLFQAYRMRYLNDPSGASAIAALRAPPYALIRAALMNTAGSDLYEARWLLTNSANNPVNCTVFTDPLLPLFCGLGSVFVDSQTGSTTLYEVRNGRTHPYVGPLGEGAGKINLGRALTALRDGVVMYSAASGSGVDAGTGPRDLQGTWQVGAVAAGEKVSQKFVVHAAPGVGRVKVRFAFTGGNPSDGSGAITSPWRLGGPASVDVPAGGDATVTFNVEVPKAAAPGSYTGALLASVSNGQTLHVPIYASVALHDGNTATGNVPGAQARVDSRLDDFAKGDTLWPAVAGQAISGSLSDWRVYPVELGTRLKSASFTAWDTATTPGTETYDLYLYGADLALETSTHPFLSPGTTDVLTNSSRAASTEAAPQKLIVTAPAAGRHYLVVSRARTGNATPGAGDFGSYALRLDEAR